MIAIEAAAIAIFLGAYALVVAEERIGLAKSKPMVVVAGPLWLLAAVATGGETATAGFRLVLLDYAELLLFLLAAMTYINVLEERRLFDVLRARLQGLGFSYRALFWLTGGLAFLLSPVADNLTTALVMGAVVLAVGRDEPRFAVPASVGIVVAANSGGAFSPFGDITTLMVWQKGLVDFGGFFRLFPPALATWLVPAALMHFAIPAGRPAVVAERVTLKPGAVTVAALFALTIAGAVTVHTAVGLPPALGMMTGLGLLQLASHVFQRRRNLRAGFNVFAAIARIEWDTLLFFYGVILSIGALATFGLLDRLSGLLYGGLGATAANSAIGILSALLDNIPLMFAVLTTRPDMPESQWLLLTLTAGTGGSLLSIGSAAGVALMGKAPGLYTFTSHLRWSWAVALGYGAGVALHSLLSAGPG